METINLETKNENKESEIRDYLNKEKNDPEQEDFLEEKPKQNKKKMAIGGLIILLVISAIAYLSYTKGQKSFANEKVTMFVEAPEDIESGDEISIAIGYKNDNEVALRDVEMEITFPEDFLMISSDKNIIKEGGIYSWQAGNVAANSTDKVRIYGKLIGNKGDTKDFRAVMKYKPANFNSNFETNITAPIKISSVPVELNIAFPEEGIKNSTDTELTFTVKNKSNRSFSKADIEIDFPESFSYTSSETSTTREDEGNNVFNFEIENLSATSEKTIKILGSFKSENKQETVKANLYLLEENGEMIKYIEQSKDFQIIKPEILVSMTVNGWEDYVAGKNEELEYKIDFENQSEKELRGLIIKSSLKGNFDLTSIQADKGTIKNNEVVWSALKVPELAQLKPQDKGTITFKVKTKDYFIIEKESDKNFTLENNITIGTASQEIANVTKTTKVKSFLAIESKGYFNDDGRIANGGALPPKVGEKTYYTIHWIIRNLFNDVENIKIVSTLPEGVRWTGKYINSKGEILTQDVQSQSQNSQQAGETENNISITAERFYYNQNLNQIVWEIPRLKSNEGILSSAKEIVFQIEVEPQEKNADKPMDIMNEVTATGNDTFALQNITGTAKKLTTELFDDYSISNEEAIVQKR